MKPLTVYLSMLCAVIVSSATADEVRNGVWWGKLNSWQRQAYITGVFDGMSLDQLALAGDQTSAQIAWNQGQRIKAIFSGITSDEVNRRMNKFYSLHVNQHVFASDAVFLVVAERKMLSSEQGKKLYREALEDARKRGAKGWRD